MLSEPPTTRVPVLSTGLILGVAAVLLSVALALLLSVGLSSPSSWASSSSPLVMFQCSKVFMERVSFLLASGAVIRPQG